MHHVDPMALLHGAVARSSMEVARARTTGALDRPLLNHGGPLGTYETSAWVDHPDTSRLLSLDPEMIEYLSIQRYSP